MQRRLLKSNQLGRAGGYRNFRDEITEAYRGLIVKGLAQNVSFRLPSKGCHRHIRASGNCNDHALHLTHKCGQHFLESLRPVGGFRQQSYNRQELLWSGCPKRGAVDQNEILGDVAFGSTKSLAFYADDFYRQTAGRRYAVIQDVSRNRREPHHDRIAARPCEQSLCEFAGEMRVYLQVTFQNSLGLGMHRSDRMPAISQGLFIDVPHRCDQALNGLRLVWFQTFHRWAEPNGSFELDVCDFQCVFHVSLSMVSKLSDDYNLSRSSYGATGHPPAIIRTFASSTPPRPGQ